MKEKYYMASTAIRGDQEAPDSQVTVKKMCGRSRISLFRSQIIRWG
ncbi:hypothetical protein M153_10230001251 [Pseudoloma neurophilia]|uniref:Uncharacterized protein n=1 Tax=Pseudoloma neurophilia TaxID=146866 RepID=A0A0R0LVH1_9MICR|nr:hypothetical protein M153_10230001251 [Pseudoloma neurophilia]